MLREVTRNAESAHRSIDLGCAEGFRNHGANTAANKAVFCRNHQVVVSGESHHRACHRRYPTRVNNGNVHALLAQQLRSLDAARGHGTDGHDEYLRGVLAGIGFAIVQDVYTIAQRIHRFHIRQQVALREADHGRARFNL